MVWWLNVNDVPCHLEFLGSTFDSWVGMVE